LSSAITLIVGLGNPGAQYQHTRHNAGALFVETLAQRQGATLAAESRFLGAAGRVSLEGRDVRLLIPATYMNRSGQAVAALAGFFKIPAASILIAHDELDLPVGTARFKCGGGHGGHNGLRSIIAALGNDAGFARLRLGIGHPGSSAAVTDYVLSNAPRAQRDALDAAIVAALTALPLAISGNLEGAMNQLHGFAAPGA